MSQSSKLASQRYFGGVHFGQIDLAGLIDHIIRSDVLVRRLVLRIKRTCLAHIPVLNPHQALITVFCIFLFESVEDTLVYSDLIFPLASHYLRCTYLNVYLGANWSEAIVKFLLPAKRMVRIEDIEGFQVELITSSEHFGQKVTLLTSLLRLHRVAAGDILARPHRLFCCVKAGVE